MICPREPMSAFHALSRGIAVRPNLTEDTMTRTTSAIRCFPLSLLIATVAAAACSDTTSPTAANATASDTTSTSVRWNQRAIALVVSRQPATNGQAVVSRILTYVSLAQYRAV